MLPIPLPSHFPPSLGVQLHHISSAEATGAAGSRVQGEGRGERGKKGEGGRGEGSMEEMTYLYFLSCSLIPCYLHVILSPCICSLCFMWVGRNPDICVGWLCPTLENTPQGKRVGAFQVCRWVVISMSVSPQKLSGQVDIPLSSTAMRTMSISPPPLLVSGNFVYVFCLLVVCVSGNFVYSFVFS